VQVPVFNMLGEISGQIELREDIFDVPLNEPLMHQALVRQQVNARLGTAKTKTRAEVSGGGRKPWRQKGTGRARQGSIRAPQWRGGGIVFGPRPRSYRQAMPRKMRHLALRCALSAKARAKEIVVVDELRMDVPRAKAFLGVLDRLGVGSSVLILLPDADYNVERSANNLPKVKTLRAQYLNLVDLFTHDYLLMPLGALGVITDMLG